jgi:hypothetical protein
MGSTSNTTKTNKTPHMSHVTILWGTQGCITCHSKNRSSEKVNDLPKG